MVFSSNSNISFWYKLDMSEGEEEEKEKAHRIEIC